MDWFKIAVDNSLHFLLLGILGFFGFLSKRLFLNPIESLQEQLIKHVTECNQIPKSLIIEKIDNINNKLEDFKENTGKELDLQRMHSRDLNEVVNKVLLEVIKK